MLPKDRNRRRPVEARDSFQSADPWGGMQPVDDRSSHRREARTKSRYGLSKPVVATLSGVVIIAAAAGLGIAVRLHSAKAAVGLHSAKAAVGLHSAKVATATAAPPKSWHLKFDPSFAGKSIDTSVFGTCYPWSTGTVGCTNYGNTSDEEKEWYLAPQDQVSGGTLRLVAQREPTPGISQKGAPEEYECRSGMITTYPGFNFEYGYVQVVAKIPFGNGLWSAIWLAAANKKWPPEVDILEHWHSDAQGKVYLHPLSGVRQGGPVSMPNLSQGEHTFALKWTPTQLTWYYDGNQVFSTTTGVPHQSMYLIANLADDTLTPGSCSGAMSIKSIKVWQPAS
jgi:beta-glucanase (GH16 family)